jgi:hypothetical protein
MQGRADVAVGHDWTNPMALQRQNR